MLLRNHIRPGYRMLLRYCMLTGVLMCIHTDESAAKSICECLLLM
jgi:hypothetical protein